MFRSMTKTTLATVLALSLAATGFAAAPARAADSGDVAKIAAGLATLFIIGKALENSDTAPDRRRPHDYRDYGHSHKPKPLPARSWQGRKHLPAQCLYAHNSWSGRITMLNRRCLEKTYRHASSLPTACRVEANTRKGMRRGYDPKCLRGYGYRLMQY